MAWVTDDRSASAYSRCAAVSLSNATPGSPTRPVARKGRAAPKPVSRMTAIGVHGTRHRPRRITASTPAATSTTRVMIAEVTARPGSVMATLVMTIRAARPTAGEAARARKPNRPRA